MQQGLTDDLYNAVDSYATNDQFTIREKLCIEFAEQFAIDHTAVGDDLWRRLRENFSDTEVLELTITIGFCVGIGRAFHVLEIARDFDVLWSKEANGTRPETPKTVTTSTLSGS
jgi:alkylhydroperoxidase family enzyme